MRYGICGGPDAARLAAPAGYDYFEWSVGALLKPREDASAFREALAQVRAAPLPCPVVNCFLPGDLKVTGTDRDLAALRRFVGTTLERAEEAGIRLIVFGSGGARRVPDGFDRAAASRQIVEFCRMLAPVAAQHGITVVVEPLNQAECNILTTVGESAALVREVNHPNVRLLVDGYHWAKDNDRVEDIVAAGDLLAHAHIGTAAHRLAPGVEPCEALGGFLAALRQAGYAGRLSIEAGTPNPALDLPRALALMQSLA